MRIPFFLIVFSVLLLGAGCALSSAESERAANVDAFMEEGVQLQETLEGGSLEASIDVESSLLAEADDGGDTPAVIDPRVIEIQAENFSFEPETISAKAYEELVIRFSTKSGPHTFVIDELNVKEDIFEGREIHITAPGVPGRYPYYCDVGPHRTLGMEGILVVE